MECSATATLALSLAVGAALAARLQSPSASVPVLDNLGSHTYAIRTGVPLAQRYFDQGLRVDDGFNHAESIRAFQEATRQDPACAMCYWGIALALRTEHQRADGPPGRPRRLRRHS